MSEPAKRRATYADLADIPENLVAELIDGVIITHPRPASPHARAASRLSIEIGPPFDRGAKLPLYAREAVAHVWLVDPLARLLEVFRPEGSRYVLDGTWRDAAGVRAAPFDAIELELGALWERRATP